jgi:hypothetical protein
MLTMTMSVPMQCPRQLAAALVAKKCAVLCESGIIAPGPPSRRRSARVGVSARGLAITKLEQLAKQRSAAGAVLRVASGVRTPAVLWMFAASV